MVRALVQSLADSVYFDAERWFEERSDHYLVALRWETAPPTWAPWMREDLAHDPIEGSSSSLHAWAQCRLEAVNWPGTFYVHMGDLRRWLWKSRPVLAVALRLEGRDP